MKRLILFFMLLSCNAFAQQKIMLPAGKKAIIVLTYDDAIGSQLRKAVPQLDSAGLTATFFLTGNIDSATLPQWRAVSKKGYELANHTLYHPCLMANVKGHPENAAENYTVFGIIREIGMMNNLLIAIDGAQNQSFAYPCTETAVGGESYVEPLRKSGLIKYARMGGDSSAVITNFKDLDPLLVPAWGVHEGTSGEKLIDFVKRVEANGGMGVFMFHGIGGDYITTTAGAHKKLLDYLKKNKSDIWVATFKQAMDYVEQQTGAVKK